ncbi:unnamed protein product [Adineta steineri]|uniref:ADP ribosyltransferase domain-containing protein n=2 Tax=Adineta steineri TaxID=433720 RepID=A0A814UXB3_9BILA|nr:unnamed protein product [Adineta steineri]CAF4124981.1 unnamed protein product [Adineta steineri]
MNRGKLTTNSSTVPKGRRRINIQQLQNVLLVWLDSNIDETNDDYQNTISTLRCAINDVNTYTNGDQCLEFIQTTIDKNVCMVISGSLGQHTVPRVHNMSQVDSIFIFSGNKTYHEQWIKDWSKIKGVFTDITPMCEALKEAAHQCEQNAIPMSFVGPNENLNRLDTSFMYTQILKEILVTIKFEQNHIQDYFDYCRDAFVDNEEEMVNIQRLEREYRSKTPIYWYTCQMFLYPMLNRALRLMNGDTITRLGFFIGDLHRQIEQLHREQYAGTTAANTFTVYRGQGLSIEDFEQTMKTKGGLISFNNFLSTSMVRKVSLDFAQDAARNPDQVGVLFIIEINPALLTTPFASIAGISKFQREGEVLFSLHSVFRIEDIKQMSENNHLHEVYLTLTAENDPELNRLTDYIRKESFPGSERWYRLGRVLRKMDEFDTAEDIYQVLFNQTKDDKNRADIYIHLGLIKNDQGKYKEALTFYEKSLDIYRKTLSANHPSLAISYSNIGNVHNSMGDYPKALSFYEKALETQQQSLSPNHPDLAISYINIGNVHNSMDNYPKALSYFEKALTIQQKSLPPDHSDLVYFYNNIGNVHSKMGNYPKALSSYEKVLEISQQSLSRNDHDLGIPLVNISNVHAEMGNYPQVLFCFEKILEVQQQSLPSNHDNLASSYNNIGNVHYRMRNYSKALFYYEKDLEISQQSLPPNHPDLAMSYNNIGNVHADIGNNPEALSSYEKALEIQQQSLPPGHPNLAASYNNIGTVYDNMGIYTKARTFYEHAIQIGQQSLSTNHPNLQQWKNNLELVKKQIINCTVVKFLMRNN